MQFNLGSILDSKSG